MTDSRGCHTAKLCSRLHFAFRLLEEEKQRRHEELPAMTVDHRL